MAGFVFRLQNVLDYRAGLADRARQELGVLQGRVREAEEELAALHRSEQRALQQLGDAQAGDALDLAEITRLLEYGQVLDQRIEELHQVVAQRQQEADAQQQKVIALAKDARALEKLRERQMEEFQQDDNRRELAEMGEIASVRHQRLQGVHP
jgi:flagellar export protein FliJ